MKKEDLDRIASHLIGYQLRVTEDVTKATYEGELLVDQVRKIRELASLSHKVMQEIVKMRASND